MAFPFENGFAVVKTKAGFGIIDSTKRFLLEPKYDSLFLGYADGYSKDTMLIVGNELPESLMITKEGKVFQAIWKK